MFLKIPGDPEALAAQGANERLLAGVKPQVGFEILSESEAFATLRAAVRPLPRVEALMAAQALPQGEGLGAVGTRIGSLPRVEALMPPEDLPAFEPLPADAASIAFARVVDNRLKTPHLVSAPGEATEAMASVGALVVTEVFRRGQARFDLGAALTGSIDILPRPKFRQREHVHQLY